MRIPTGLAEIGENPPTDLTDSAHFSAISSTSMGIPTDLSDLANFRRCGRRGVIADLADIADFPPSPISQRNR